MCLGVGARARRARGAQVPAFTGVAQTISRSGAQVERFAVAARICRSTDAGDASTITAIWACCATRFGCRRPMRRSSHLSRARCATQRASSFAQRARRVPAPVIGAPAATSRKLASRFRYARNPLRSCSRRASSTNSGS